MLYIDSIWEYIVNFLELALFIIFIHKKLRIRANYKHQAVLMFLFVSFQFAVLCHLVFWTLDMQYCSIVIV